MILGDFSLSRKRDLYSRWAFCWMSKRKDSYMSSNLPTLICTLEQRKKVNFFVVVFFLLKGQNFAIKYVWTDQEEGDLSILERKCPQISGNDSKHFIFLKSRYINLFDEVCERTNTECLIFFFFFCIHNHYHVIPLHDLKHMYISFYFS